MKSEAMSDQTKPRKQDAASDQPKPTTGEWTPHDVRENYQIGGWEFVAKGINAAIAAEREKHTPSEIAGIRVRWPLQEEIQQLREQRDEAIRLLHYEPQPKPTTGEWTVIDEDHGKIARIHCGKGESVAVVKELNPAFATHLKWFARLHNAALAAAKNVESERNELAVFVEEWKHRAQHAERELNRSAGVESELIKQLAAEQESYKLLEEHAKRENQQLREQRDEAIRLLEYKEKQLAAAEEQDWRHMKKADKEVMLERRQRDAAQKPLVTLLEDMKRLEPKFAIFIDQALAKVKEGK